MGRLQMVDCESVRQPKSWGTHAFLASYGRRGAGRYVMPPCLLPLSRTPGISLISESARYPRECEAPLLP